MTSQLERPDAASARPTRRGLAASRPTLGRLATTAARAETKLATPTPRALWLALTGALFLAAGIHAELPPLTLLGALVLALVAACWFIALMAAQTLGEAHIALLAERPDKASQPEAPEGPDGADRADRTRGPGLADLVDLAATPLEGPRNHAKRSAPRSAQVLALGRPLLITARLTPPPLTRGLSFSLIPRAGDALRVEAASQDELPTPRDSIERRDLSFSVTGLRLGDAFLHGFVIRAEVALGLFGVSSWLPRRLAFKTLPERLVSRSPRLSATRAIESQSELVQRDKRGFGMEIRELRDFAPGDPFKHIAWRASARRGKLIAREFESERSLSVWLCLDVSPSMWWGPVGRARIDHALAMACELARTLTAGRDKVGLVIHDHTSRIIIEPGRGTTQHTRMLEALLEVPHLTLEDMTEVTDRELIDRVLRWFEVQEQRTFPRLSQRSGRRSERPAPRQSPVDVSALAAACRLLLRDRRRVLPEAAYAVDPDLAALRVFCREVGIALPPDPTARPGGQAHGLEAALAAVLSPVAGKKSSAHTIVSLSDLATADDLDALRRVALTARRHRHGLVFIQPVGERAELPPIVSRRGQAGAERLARALIDIQTLRADENRRRVQTLLKPSGASFITVSPGESLAKVMSQLEAVS